MIKKILLKNNQKIQKFISQQEISTKFPGDPLNQLRLKLITKKQEENFDIYTNEFFNYLKLNREQNQIKNIQTSSQDQIFLNNLNLKMIRNTNYYLQSKMASLIGLSFYCILNTHYIVSILPILFMFRPYVQYKFASQFLTKIVYKIELMKDKETVKLYLGCKQTVILCQIQKIDLLDIVPVDANFEQEVCSVKHENNLESFMLNMNVIDINGMNHEKLRLIIQPSLTQIFNIDLLHHILNGEQKQVKKFNILQ